MSESTTSAEWTVSFGPFRLLPAQQLLLEDEAPVRLSSRAFEILAALVESAGELVSKNDLIARVWPNTFIDENTLRVHIAGLRRALGDGQPGRRYLANVPGRGYRFVAPVELSSATTKLAELIASKPSKTVKIGKEAFYRQLEMGLSQAYDYASEVMTANMLAAEAEEGIGAFVEKREPHWPDR